MAGEKSPNLKQISGGPVPGAGERPELKPLRRGQAQLFEVTGNIWRVVIDQECTPQDLDASASPNFWSLLEDGERGVQEGDEIKARWANGMHFASYTVVNAGPSVAAVRLNYAVKGSPIMTAEGGGFPVGFHIEKARPDENNGRGFVAVRDSDGHRYLNSGAVPWKTEHDLRSEFPKNAMFRGPDTTIYYA